MLTRMPHRSISRDDVFALAIFFSYFSIIIILFALILRSMHIRLNSLKYRSYIYISLAILSFAHTWFYMFKFLRWSFVNYEMLSGRGETDSSRRLAAWLRNTELFEQAWAAVCSRPLNWFWSEQLCLFTVGAWTIFLALQGRQRSIKHVWAYMILGQLVAISVASNLFLFALTLPQAPTNVSKGSRPLRRSIIQTNTQISSILLTCVIASLMSVAISPFTSERTFLPNLLTMHVLIIIPLLPSVISKLPSKTSCSVRSLYVIAAVMGLALRLRTTVAAFRFLPEELRSISGFLTSLRETLYSHPAQSSIGWDVIWTSISFLFWVALGHTDSKVFLPRHRSTFLISLIFLTIILSIGVASPLALFAELA